MTPNTDKSHRVIARAGAAAKPVDSMGDGNEYEARTSNRLIRRVADAPQNAAATPSRSLTISKTPDTEKSGRATNSGRARLT